MVHFKKVMEDVIAEYSLAPFAWEVREQRECLSCRVGFFLKVKKSMDADEPGSHNSLLEAVQYTRDNWMHLCHAEKYNRVRWDILKHLTAYPELREEYEDLFPPFPGVQFFDAPFKKKVTQQLKDIQSRSCKHELKDSTSDRDIEYENEESTKVVGRGEKRVDKGKGKAETKNKKDWNEDDQMDWTPRSGHWN